MGPPPINRNAAGFLGFVDVKSMGKNPRTVEENVRPTINMAPWYYAEPRQRFTGNGITPAGPDTYWDSPNVPRNKVWLVSSVWVQADAVFGAGVTFSGSAAIGRLQSVGAIGVGDVMWRGQQSLVWSTGDGGILVADYFAEPFLMLPGWRFAVSITRVTGGPALRIGACFVEVDL